MQTQDEVEELRMRNCREFSAVTKSGMGTWDSGTPGLGDAGTWDAKTLGLGMWDVGTRGRDKQTTPDFCAEL